MAFVRIQGTNEKRKGIYYEYDPTDTPLGRGGMGKVYKGWLCSETSEYRREVAIKFLYSDLPEHVIDRARREASVQLRNDNLIEMLGFVETLDEDESGKMVVRYHVVSEYLHGVGLNKLFAGKISDYKGAVIPYAQQLYYMCENEPYNFALTVTRSILSGLMALHDAGYIHRDIDPSNIMVTSSGQIKLIDFGSVRKINGGNIEENSYTVDGQFLGKPKYAAPELVRGLIDSQGPVTDLYAVGIMLYQLLVGHVPFEGEMADVLEMQLNKKVPSGEVKQKQIRKVILKATQKKRSLRYQSAAEFRVAVDSLVSLPYPEKGVGLKVAGLVAGLAAIIVGVSYFSGLFGNSAKIEQEEAVEEIAAANVPTDTVVMEQPQPKATEQIPEQKQTTQTLTYSAAVDSLYKKATARKGFEMLNTLAAENDYNSIFLLSRLYLNSPDEVRVGAFTDSVARIKNNLRGIIAYNGKHNQKAHALLMTAVKLNSNDYRSLFELGCDYKSGRRGVHRNEDSAYICLSTAKRLAKIAGDKKYQTAIEKRMVNMKSSNNK